MTSPSPSDMDAKMKPNPPIPDHVQLQLDLDQMLYGTSFARLDEKGVWSRINPTELSMHQNSARVPKKSSFGFRSCGKLKIGDAFIVSEFVPEDCGIVVNKTFLHYVVVCGHDRAVRVYFKWRNLVKIGNSRLYHILRTKLGFTPDEAEQFTQNAPIPSRYLDKVEL